MNPILLQIFNRPWYINQRDAIDLKWAVSALLDGRLVFEADREKFKPRTQIGEYSYSDDFNARKNGVVAIIPVQGVLMQKDQECGPVGMETIASYIRNADEDPSVNAIILDINSPGGTVAGTPNFGKAIEETKKPIIAFVNELAASAAYWAASKTDMIIASDKNAEVGSIGVQLEFMDLQPYYEDLKVKFHSIQSNYSKLKNQDFRDIQAGNYDQYRKEVLDPLALRFIEEVKKSRGKIKDDDLLAGKVVFAEYGIEANLVDRIASLDEAIQIALDMAEKQNNKNLQSQAISNQIKISSNMKKFPQLNAALEVELEMSDGGSFLNEAQLDKLEEMLVGHQAAIAKVAGERDAANNNLAAAQDQAKKDIESKDKEIASLTAQVNEQKTELDNIRKNGVEGGASIIVKKDPEASGEKDPVLAELDKCTTTIEKMAVLLKHGLS